MKNLKCLPQLLSILFVLVCFHVSVLGQENTIAKVSGSGDTVRWEITVAYSAATLTVSGSGCGVVRKEFKEGSAPTFAIYDRNGNRLPDGQYNYELRLTPVLSAETVKDLAAARQKGGVAEEDADCRVRSSNPTSLVQSGAFSVIKGSVVVAGAVEPDASRQTGKTLRRPMTARPFVQSEDVSMQEATYIFARAVEAAAPRAYGKMAGLPLAHPALPDQVIPDDLIVQGSLCVGFDCVNNESFGFDTIRLKENNTRIKFEDTSVGSFPTNDWQLTANDSASGGASKFSIEDITGSKVPFTITAGAATNSVFVDSTGRVGFRTSTPVLDLHVNTSNTPAIRLEQNNSGGFTAQTWDIAGNEANFFIRDVTGGSKLSFRIRPGAPTSSIDISADGDVGIGTASPVFSANSAKFLAVDAGTGAFAEVGAGGNQSGTTAILGTFSFFNKNLATAEKRNAVIAGANDGATNSGNLQFFTVNAGTIGERMRINKTGQVGIGTTAPTDTLSVNGTASKPGGGSWSVFSDERLKNIKGNFNSGLKAVMQLRPLRYEYKRNNALGLKSEGEHVGFGAQEVQKIIPEAVTRTENGYLLVNNDPIIWTMLNAIKEQQKEIEQLKAQIRQLQPRAGNRTRNRRR